MLLGFYSNFSNRAIFHFKFQTFVRHHCHLTLQAPWFALYALRGVPWLASQNTDLAQVVIEEKYYLVDNLPNSKDKTQLPLRKLDQQTRQSTLLLFLNHHFDFSWDFATSLRWLQCQLVNSRLPYYIPPDRNRKYKQLVKVYFYSVVKLCQ